MSRRDGRMWIDRGCKMRGFDNLEGTEFDACQLVTQTRNDEGR